MTSLIEPLKLITKRHCEKDDKHMYSYSEEGMQVYRSFANEMAQIMNESGMHNVGSHQQQDAESQTQTLSGHILTTKGASAHLAVW